VGSNSVGHRDRAIRAESRLLRTRMMEAGMAVGRLTGGGLGLVPLAAIGTAASTASTIAAKSAATASAASSAATSGSALAPTASATASSTSASPSSSRCAVAPSVRV
jgi:hypothetical protein